MAKKRLGKKTAAPGRLRIVGGRLRSRVLPVPAVEGLRPTPERVRETLFNWLAEVTEGSRCLDLCAGTGALGFEALSRGAAQVTFVENSRVASSALQKAADLLEASNVTIANADALQWLATAPASAFDIVFVDPPYAAGLVPDLCRLLDTRGWLADRALVYLEHDKRQAAPLLPENWLSLKDKNAGNVRYCLFAVQAAR
ncbi:MAG: 16S rRNA (guanine(966)-N(2))-methyltransferase RsmD [Woeseia sp.]|nr:16S rRNA (guanine(966)-N(2))-methyltransferase RsmD [Woeseia sp.]MBT8097252.1 16S rRNA (guanine(966)-N(2))-methyltransferase RsmD [Woeseia sp.]NNE59779.1 16S rRNA (guanine(966)-N(2))-methyltransferase RsmD [Woeseia sp.]NNL54676.1 16S rRNA (guanine(966)-N(2))-methyltransferase RsmD [Woeseia sp.]